NDQLAQATAEFSASTESVKQNNDALNSVEDAVRAGTTWGGTAAAGVPALKPAYDFYKLLTGSSTGTPPGMGLTVTATDSAKIVYTPLGGTATTTAYVPKDQVKKIGDTWYYVPPPTGNITYQYQLEGGPPEFFLAKPDQATSDEVLPQLI